MNAIAPYDQDNIFARILRGELPCVKVCEDDATLVIMDIMPQSRGHSLIISKEAAVTLFDLSPGSAADCMRMTQRIAIAARAAFAADGVTIMQFNGSAAGQSVPHVHFHVVPRRAGEAMARHATQMADPGQLEALAMQLRAALTQ
ncbi:MAG: HIT domain-containing protein [Steroidobacteraceae bacterium]